jgi:peptidoglycan glycosyltransferase
MQPEYRNHRFFRRSLAGRPIPRHRPMPRMLRPEPKRGTSAASWALRLMFGLAVIAVVLALSGVGSAYGAYTQLSESLAPRLAQIKQHDSFQTTRIYDRNGTLLYEFFGSGKRTEVPLSNISPLLIHATVSIEDKTFYQNQGVDYEGIAKAFGRSLNAGEVTGGASTLTQQLIKLVVLTDTERLDENKYQRKVKEIVLAQELTRQYSKDDILNLYLNEIYYGNLAYGIEAASEVYFGTHAKDLTLAQASLLAGLPQLPSVYDPINYLEDNVLKGVPLKQGWLDPNYQLPQDTPPPKARQIAVLTQMVDEGYVTEADARRAASDDLKFASQDVPLNAPHFVFYVRKLLEEQYGPQFANLGLSIYTSLDLNIQRMVQQKAKERIAEMEARNIHNAAVVVMQPNSGQILAMVGSIDYNSVVPSKTGHDGNVLDGQVNVTVRERQPGSALKPFTYLSAMDHGITPATLLWDVPTEFTAGKDPYKPENYNGRWNGPVRIRTALANSLNMPAVKALKFAGVQNTIDLLHRAGITGLQRGANVYGLSLTLGGGEVTPLDLTTAYNTLASGGRYYPPQPFLRIINGKGEALPFDVNHNVTGAKTGDQVLNKDHVAIISDMLSDDNARRAIWGLNSRLKLSRPAAVKTGTTNDWRDAWAVGYTPYVTVGVWTGNNNNEKTAEVESIQGGGEIWHNVMESLFATPEFEKVLAEPYNGKVPRDFSVPSEVQTRPICSLPGPFGNYSRELFSPDMLKSASDDSRLGCDSFQKVTVMRLSGSGDNGDPGSYCRPTAGMTIPAGLATTINIWKTPPADPDEKVRYVWSGGSAGGNVPVCSQEQYASVIEPTPEPTPEPAPGSVIMPDLRKFGENQAKERLAALGVTNYIYVDYQTRERIPAIYDQFSPYAVVSTIPAAGQPIVPGTTIVLGIRAPDPQPAAPPADQPPAPPAPQPSEGQPPAP